MKKGNTKVSYADLLTLIAAVQDRFRERCPKCELTLNTTLKNYADLADDINEVVGETIIKDTWLRQRMYYDVAKKSDRSINNLMLDALHQYTGTTSPNRGIQNTNHGYSGNYKLVARRVHQEKGVDPNYHRCDVTFGSQGIVLEEHETTTRYLRLHHHFVLGVDYFALQETNSKEIVYLILHRGQSYKNNWTLVPGMFLGVDIGLRPVTKPVMLVREDDNDYGAVLEQYFATYDFTAITGKLIANVRRMGSDLQLAPDPKRQQREGLNGLWYTITYSDIRKQYEISYLHIKPKGVEYHSEGNSFHKGSAKMHGFSLVVNFYRESRFASIICKIGDLQQTQRIRRMIAACASTGQDEPAYGYSVLLRAGGEQEELPKGRVDPEKLVASGVRKKVLENMRKHGFRRVNLISQY